MPHHGPSDLGLPVPDPFGTQNPQPFDFSLLTVWKDIQIKSVLLRSSPRRKH
jgi:hypothetical protein